MHRLSFLLLLPVFCFSRPLPDKIIWNCDQTNDIAGLELSSERKKEGSASVRWRNHQDISGITITDIPHDWTGYQLLQFWAYNKTASESSQIVCLFSSENKETEGMDYWSYKINLAFTGWKKFYFPINVNGGSRSPRGWDQIDYIRFTATGWGCKPSPESDLLIDDIRLVDLPEGIFAVMSDAEFFSEFDLEKPGLESIKRAVESKNFPEAKKALLKHFRERKSPKWLFDWRDRPTDLPPPKPGSDGWDYFSNSFAVDWVGWKEFTFPFAKWNSNREPQGWHYITSLRFSSTYGDRTPNPQTILAFDDMRFEGKQPLPIGNFEDDADFARWPQLKAEPTSGCSGKTAGCWNVARQPDLRARNMPRDWRPYSGLRLRIHSAAATGDRIVLLADSDIRSAQNADRQLAHYYKGHFLGEDIDWESNNRKPGDPAFTKEWTYNLNRFSMWCDLGKAYWETGDEKYAKEWIAQMHDWVEDNPYPRFTTGNRGLTWRTIEAGIRCSSSWPDSLMYFLGSPSLRPDDLALFLKSWIDHARHLMRITVEHPEHGGNWVTMECNGLGHLGILLPECKNSGTWLKTAVDRMTMEIDRQVYPDGAQKELTTGYHQVSRKNFVGLYKFAMLNEIPMPATYLSGLERMYEYNLKAADPEAKLPPLNDAGRTAVRESLQEGYDFFQREDFLWLATQGRKGTKPAFTSIAMPWAGQYVMRSGWEPDAHYSLFESGPFGIGHQHEDKLSLFIHALGRELLTEAGTYRYDASVYRRYALGSWAHNVILVDGEGQRRREVHSSFSTDSPLDNLWIHNDLFDAADGVYEDGYGRGRKINVLHERTVVFLRNDYWLVLDRIRGEGDHKLDILWNLKANTARQMANSLAAHGTDEGVPNLLVTPAKIEGLGLQIITGRHDPPLGFSPAGRKTPIPVLNYQLGINGTITLAWVLTPYRGTPPKVSLDLKEKAEGCLVVITRPNGTDTVFIAPRGQRRHVPFDGISHQARVAVKRQITGQPPQTGAE